MKKDRLTSSNKKVATTSLLKDCRTYMTFSCRQHHGPSLRLRRSPPRESNTAAREMASRCPNSRLQKASCRRPKTAALKYKYIEKNRKQLCFY